MSINVFNYFVLNSEHNLEDLCPGGAPCLKNQGPHAFATYSKIPYVAFFVFVFSVIKHFMYNFIDKSTRKNMYT